MAKAKTVTPKFKIVDAKGGEIKSEDLANKLLGKTKLFYKVGDQTIKIPTTAKTEQDVTHILQKVQIVEDVKAVASGKPQAIAKNITMLCGAIYEYELVVALESQWFNKLKDKNMAKRERGRTKGVETKIANKLKDLKNSGRFIFIPGDNKMYNIRADKDTQKLIHEAAEQAAARYLKDKHVGLELKIESAGDGGNELGDVKVTINGKVTYVEAKWSPKFLTKKGSSNKIWWWRPSISVFNSDYKNYLAGRTGNHQLKAEEYQKYMGTKLIDLENSDFFKSNNNAKFWLLYLLSKGSPYTKEQFFKNDLTIGKDVLVGYSIGADGRAVFYFNSGELMDKIYDQSAEITITKNSKSSLPRVDFHGSDKSLIGSFQMNKTMYDSLLTIGRERPKLHPEKGEPGIKVEGNYEFVLYANYLASKFKQ